ncbi:MAG: DUF4861 family protein [Flavobacterium sp.]|nr:DUF4861 family protein [Flavobacterium sp.]
MKFNLIKTVSFLGILVLFSSFTTKKHTSKKIIVTNSLAINRENEVVSINLKQLQNLTDSYQNLLIKDENGNLLVTQIIDNNLDGKPDELLFRVTVLAHSRVIYTAFVNKKASKKRPLSPYTTYARFVPERTDDFTWENDKVAFRTYGPTAQKLVEEGKQGGTLSSGIDLWLKKVNYSIIDKWYSNNLQTAGYYHIDHGEGYDPYHVGKSRGTGGNGIWLNDSLHVSKNFVNYRVIATGPIRTIFELDYNSWSKFGVKETKRISLDLGSNFTKFENTISSEFDIPNYTLGITLHDQKGKVDLNITKGIFRYWEPIDDSFVGEGIVIAPNLVKTALNHHSKSPDQSQILVVTEPKNKKIVYYVGFAWLKSGQVNSVADWDSLLERQQAIINSPLIITM